MVLLALHLQCSEAEITRSIDGPDVSQYGKLWRVTHPPNASDGSATTEPIKYYFSPKYSKVTSYQWEGWPYFRQTLC